jgi:hypothetical protein
MSTRRRMLSREPNLRPQQSVLERRRLAAANLFVQGVSAAVVALRLGVSRQAARSAGIAGCCPHSSTRWNTPCERELVPTGSRATGGRWSVSPR